METEATARSVSIDILNEFDETDYLDYSSADDLDQRDRAEVREYVQNILRRRSYLDFLISQFANVSLDEMKTQLKNILRLGVYDMVFMDSTPDYAAINESVEIAKYSLGSRTGDLVNAILRNLQREKEKDQLPKPNFKDRTKLIATTFSHPKWMVERWVKRFGEREAFQLMQANNKPPANYVRVNTLRTKAEYFKLRMEKNDVAFRESDWLPGYYEVDSVAPFINKGWIKKGFCWIQDIAAGFAPTALNPNPNESVYDFCAAPGTKTVLLSGLMNGEGEILAVDISGDRLEKLAENALAFQAENIKVRRADVRELELPETDAILLDAPCTGTGVLSKRADLRWRRDLEGLQNAVELQKELLDSSAKMVKPGGRLVYSTCSLEEEENWGQVTNFLERHDNFELESLEGYLPDEVLVEETKAYQTFPHKHNCDGHFGVRLKRVN
ncbi:16S rRNA (cytosine(967)-C(5))-methyltransferase RsmB [Aliifodinibius sp. S!AR15-10]|uniref:16S rRNA (cytosine(967)-C(5))-methyltransferase RsmB n=1 Tax=Aliifodinibius sp. S!AR15-10 TaxID=2950437 RepID=UPI002861F805|nr:16S rRNA (cytosine(967)-C(5))-methyltransferase RsmB [Aliifodinibius sp. S!AR15-10]MDR8390185.1 16S rRNA (cytosine(967)-C(5))-methyltransferase RsmB [Aliifodinibius sp. S!AR15-10]